MRVAVLEPLGVPAEALEAEIRLACAEQADSLEIVTYANRSEDPSTLVQRAQDAEIVVLSNIPFPAAVLERLPRLQYICVAFAGYDHIDMNYCHAHGIRVANCAGYSTTAVAELVIAFAINLGRSVLPCDAAVRAQGTKDGLVGPELEGKTFGIIGLGAIGTRVAQLAQAFGCKVLAYNRSAREVPGVHMVSLEELLAQSDIISVHVPQNAETTHMIGEAQFALCKPSAYFINCARGPIVDSQALAQALNEGKLAGAAVDVFETEPPIAPDHALLTARNVIATPHIAFASHQAFEKRARIVAQNIATYMQGNPQNIVA